MNRNAKCIKFSQLVNISRPQRTFHRTGRGQAEQLETFSPATSEKKRKNGCWFSSQ